MMYCRSGTGGGGRWCGEHFVFTWWVTAQHFAAWNDVMAAILKLWRQIENPIPSIYARPIEEHSCQISSRSDLKRRSFRFLEEVVPNKNNISKMSSSDRRSVPDLKIVCPWSTFHRTFYVFRWFAWIQPDTVEFLCRIFEVRNLFLFWVYE